MLRYWDVELVRPFSQVSQKTARLGEFVLHALKEGVEQLTFLMLHRWLINTRSGHQLGSWFRKKPDALEESL